MSDLEQIIGAVEGEIEQFIGKQGSESATGADAKEKRLIGEIRTLEKEMEDALRDLESFRRIGSYDRMADALIVDRILKPRGHGARRVQIRVSGLVLSLIILAPVAVLVSNLLAVVVGL